MFLLEVPIVFFHFSLEFVVELYSGVNPRSSASKDGLQGTAEGTFQPFALNEISCQSQLKQLLTSACPTDPPLSPSSV